MNENFDHGATQSSQVSVITSDEDDYFNDKAADACGVASRMFALMQSAAERRTTGDLDGIQSAVRSARCDRSPIRSYERHIDRSDSSTRRARRTRRHTIAPRPFTPTRWRSGRPNGSSVKARA
jgi:hypothetical protein